MDYGSLGINSNQLLGVTTTYKRSAAFNRRFTFGRGGQIVGGRGCRKGQGGGGKKGGVRGWGKGGKTA